VKTPTLKYRFESCPDYKNKVMENIEYYFWEIQYKSCEGNDRWVVARTPIDWEEYDVRDRISMGGSGDDVAEIKDVFETSNTDYSWDFCE
jgi:hypothetical protein